MFRQAKMRSPRSLQRGINAISTILFGKEGFKYRLHGKGGYGTDKGQEEGMHLVSFKDLSCLVGSPRILVQLDVGAAHELG